MEAMIREPILNRVEGLKNEKNGSA
jgi:hypothetical protein